MITTKANINNPLFPVPTVQTSVWSDFTGYTTYVAPTLALSSTTTMILATAPPTSTWSEFTGF